MIEITRKNHVICEECGNADSGNNNFQASTKLDDRLSKDNMKTYEVKWVYGGAEAYGYPKIALQVGDKVITEALGIDIEFKGRKYKVFDVDHIVAIVGKEREQANDIR